MSGRYDPAIVARAASRLVSAVVCLVLAGSVAVACSDDTDGESAGGSNGAGTSTPPSTTAGAEPGAVERSAALTEPEPGVYELAWGELIGAPLYVCDNARDPDDPFWHLHNNAETDGFFLSLEMFTTGFGSAWQGETGTFEIDCSEDGTGICLHFNPDGPLEDGDLGADFGVTGDIRIDQLDDAGYALTLTDVTFTYGLTIPGPTTISG